MNDETPMRPALFLKVYLPSGKHFTRRIERPPFFIGRGADSDLVLTTDDISLTHAVIHWDAYARSYVLEDKNSTNGIFFNGIQHTRILLKHNDRVFIAQTALDIEIPDQLHDMTREIDLTQWHEWNKKQQHSTLSMALLILIPSLLICLGSYFLWYVPSENLLQHYMNYALLTPVMILFGLSGALSALSKVHNKHYHFISFLYLISWTTTCYLIYITLSPFLLFHLNSSSLEHNLNFFIPKVILAILLWNISYLFTRHLSPLKRLMIAISPACLIIAIKIIPALHKHGGVVSDSFHGKVIYTPISFSAKNYPLSQLQTAFKKGQTRTNHWRAKALDEEHTNKKDSLEANSPTKNLPEKK